MKNIMWLSIVLLVTSVGVNGCKTTGQSPDHAAMAGTTVTIAPNGFHEACDSWGVGQVVDYSFTAGAPLDFNVHYHAQHEKVYPVQEDNVTSKSGSFTVAAEAIHCCFWKNNGPLSVEMTFDMQVR